MKISRARIFLFTSTLALTICLNAQNGQPPVASDSVDSSARVMGEALKFRAEIAAAVASGTTMPDAALGQMQERGKASGLEVGAEADLAYAAIDVGQRLIVARKPEKAEEFFRAAAASLALLVKNTPDARATDKAQFLRKLALVRGQYLNQAAQAALDLDQALALVPQDTDLILARQVLANTTDVNANKPQK